MEEATPNDQYILPINDQYGNKRVVLNDGLDGWRATHGLDEHGMFPDHQPENKEWR